MPTGSVPLLEAAKCGDDTLKLGVVTTIIQESPILEQLPFTTIMGNALKHTAEDTLPDASFRDVNETYTRSWGTDTEHFWGVSILGGEVFVDNYLLKVTANKLSIKAKQYRKFAKSMALTFDKTFFDGTGTAKDFKGMNLLIDESFGQRFDVAVNGAALALADLDESHDLLRSQAFADAILCNRFHRRKITDLARTTHSGFSLIDIGTDVFGRKVTMWNDIPLRIIGDDKTKTPILGFDETQGSSNVASSLYFVAYGDEENVTGLLGMGGSWDVVDFGETEAAPGHLGRVEVYPGIAIYNPFSVVRVAGILQS